MRTRSVVAALTLAAALWAWPAQACIDLTVQGEMDPGLPDSATSGPLCSKVTLTSGCAPFDLGSGSAGPDGTAGTYYFVQLLLQSRADGRVFLLADPNLCPTTGPSPQASLSGASSIVSWSDWQIVFRLKNFWADANGNYICDGDPGAGENIAIPLSAMLPGVYDLYVRQVYWVDRNGNGVLDQPLPGIPEDPANEVVTMAASDSVYVQINTDPYVTALKPKPVQAGTALSVVGLNFGAAQSDSTIEISKGDGTLVTTLGADSPRMRNWTEGRVRFRMPGKAGQVRWVAVRVAGRLSNRVKVRLAP